MMMTGFRSASLALGLGLISGVAGAENPVTTADLALLKKAYELSQGGDYDAALTGYRALREGAASSESVREAAIEGQAYIMVADLRAKMDSAGDDAVMARFLNLDRRNTLAFIDGEMRTLDSDVMAYIRMAADEDGALGPDSFAGHPFHAELVRLEAVMPEPEPEPEPQVEPEPREAAPAAQPRVTNQGGQVFVALENARIRSGPGTQFQPSGSLVRGTEVTVIGVVVLDDGRRWFQLSGNRGYVFSTLLQPAETARPQPQAQVQARPQPQAQAPRAQSTACGGLAIGTYRIIKHVPVFQAPGSGQVGTLTAGNLISDVTGVSGGYLVRRTSNGCRYVPADPDRVMRLSE